MGGQGENARQNAAARDDAFVRTFGRIRGYSKKKKYFRSW